LPGDVQLLHPRVVENLAPACEHGIQEDVLGAGHVPEDPGDRVEVLAGPHPELLLAEAVEYPLDGGGLVAGDVDGVHGAVLGQEQIAHVHGGSSSSEATMTGRAEGVKRMPKRRGRVVITYVESWLRAEGAPLT